MSLILSINEQLALRNLFAMCLHLNSNEFKIIFQIDCNKNFEITVKTQQKDAISLKNHSFKLDFSTEQRLQKIELIKKGIQQLYHNSFA